MALRANEDNKTARRQQCHAFRYLCVRVHTKRTQSSDKPIEQSERAVTLNSVLIIIKKHKKTIKPLFVITVPHSVHGVKNYGRNHILGIVIIRFYVILANFSRGKTENSVI